MVQALAIPYNTALEQDAQIDSSASVGIRSGERVKWRFLKTAPDPWPTSAEVEVEEAEGESSTWKYSLRPVEYQPTSSVEVSEEEPEKADRKILVVPQQKVLQDAKSQLTHELRNLLKVVDAITLTKSMQSKIPIASLVLSSFTDVEEGWKELVYEINVPVGAPQALAFWDCLGTAIDRWKAGLPEYQARVLAEKLAIHVNWT